MQTYLQIVQKYSMHIYVVHAAVHLQMSLSVFCWLVTTLRTLLWAEQESRYTRFEFSGVKFILKWAHNSHH